MKVRDILNYLVVLFASQNCLNAQPPKAPSQPVTETFFGKQITDPYRNLENLKDSSVLNWYEAQAAYAEEQLKKLPQREKIYREIRELDDQLNYQIRIGENMAPVYRGNKIFYVKTLAGEQTGKFYYNQEGIDNDILIFDPNKNNPSEQLNVISGFSVNDDGSKACLIVTQGGNEVGQMFIIDTRLKQPIDSIERVWWPANWQNNEIFFYSQAATTDVHSKSVLSNWLVKKHSTGKDVSTDAEVLSYKNNPDLVPDSSKFVDISMPHKNARYLVAAVAGAEQFRDFYLSHFDPQRNSPIQWYPFIKKEDQIIKQVIQGDNAFGLSVKDNKKGKILLTSAANPNWSNARLIAEAERGSLTGINPFVVTKDYVYYVETYGVEQTLYRVKPDGPQKQKIKLPVAERIILMSGPRTESVLKIAEISHIHPTVVYGFDEIKNSIIQPGLWLSPRAKGIENMEVEETYAASYDGTRVPLTIVKPKGIRKDGSHKVILYGYGNYGIVEPPIFDPALSVMGRYDIIYAIAHVRGGGEFGEQWRLGGFKSTKSNTWKDAIACAEYLIKEGYTNSSHMAIMGISAGGILAGRAMTERPDLFSVAIPMVGVLNTLRFEFTPNGPNHIPEFGTIKNENDFRNLYEMDSYAHIHDGVKYPATLVTGGMNDPRVILWQPGKFAARLQQASASGKPVWFRIDMHGGHGTMASTKEQQFRLYADVLAFFLSQTNSNDKKGF